MANCEQSEVAQEGAEEITARWLFHGAFDRELAGCRSGNVSQRKGVAQVAAHFMSRQEYIDKCIGLLSPLLDDPEQEVRHECVGVWNNSESLKISAMPPFAEAFVQSWTFADEPGWLLLALNDYEGSLLPYSECIVGMCRVFSDSLADATRTLATRLAHDASYLPLLLLRLYEQAGDASQVDIRNKCLDAWDVLFESRVGMIRELTKAIDQ